MICYVLAMGKRHLGPHVVVGYGIKNFSPGLFITSPDHLGKVCLQIPFANRKMNLALNKLELMMKLVFPHGVAWILSRQ